MKTRAIAPTLDPHIMIRVSGKLFEGHLAYLRQMVQSAHECQLWPLLDLSHLEEVDLAAVTYLIDGENRDFGVVSCSVFIRDWMERERNRAAA